MPDLLKLVKRIGTQAPEDFVAPLPAVGTVSMAVLQNGVPYRFKVTSPEAPGWWTVRPADKRWATPTSPAESHAVVDYLLALPKRRVIALLRLDDYTWLCVPAFPHSEAQRGWPNGEPRQLHLIRETIQPLDVVIARDLAGTLLYDEIDTVTPQGLYRAVRESLDENGESPLDPGRGGLTTALTIMRAHFVEQRRLQAEAEAERLRAAEAELKLLRAAERAKREAELRNNLGERLNASLSFLGAQMLGWNEDGNNIRVRWSFNGHQTSTVVNRELQVVSAGFCLAHTDHRHTLTSLVQVMEEARAVGRMDGTMAEYRKGKSQGQGLQYVDGWNTGGSDSYADPQPEDQDWDD